MLLGRRGVLAGVAVAFAVLAGSGGWSQERAQAEDASPVPVDPEPEREEDREPEEEDPEREEDREPKEEDREPEEGQEPEEEGREPPVVVIAEYDDGEAGADEALLSFLAEEGEQGGDGRFVLLREYENLPLVAIRVRGLDADAAIRVLEDEDIEGVVRVTEDELGTTTLDRSVERIGGLDARDLGLDGAGTTIAVLDTGIDAEHTFIDAQRLIHEGCFSTAIGEDRVSLCPDGGAEPIGVGAASSETDACFDDDTHLCDHGPYVTGIAAGSGSGDRADGVAPAADIVAYQVFHRIDDPAGCDRDNPEDPDPGKAPCNRSRGSDRIAAIDDLIGLIDDGLDVVALNVSIGSGKHTEPCPERPMEVAYARLRERGVVPVESAGNDGFGNAVGHAACAPSAMTVGNAIMTGPSFWYRPGLPFLFPSAVWHSSNRGELVDVFAPGAFIDSSTTSPSSFDSQTGTSAAAPHVTGALALLAQAHPDRDTEELEEALIRSGRPLTYPSGPGSTLEDDDGEWTEEVTTPLIDVERALRRLELDDPFAVEEMEFTIMGGGSADGSIVEVEVNEGELTTLVTVTGGLEVEVGDTIGVGGGDWVQEGDTWQWQIRRLDGRGNIVETDPPLRALDLNGVYGLVNLEIEVKNVAPTITSHVISQPFINNPIVMEVTAEDPGINDFPTFLIDPAEEYVEVVCSDSAGNQLVVDDVAFSQQERPTFGNNRVVEVQILAACLTDDPGLAPPVTVEVTVTDKDGGSDTSIQEAPDFLDPLETPIRDIRAQSPVAGWLEASTVIEQVEREVILDLDVFGPPDLDLDLTWQWGDGTAPLSVAHPLGREEDLAPENARGSTRGVRSSAAHTWREPGLYRAELVVRGGDQVSAPSEVPIAVTGRQTTPRDAVGWAQWAGDDEPVLPTTRAATDDSWRSPLVHTRSEVATTLVPAASERDVYLELLEHLSPAVDDPDLERLRALLATDAEDDRWEALEAQLVAAWLNVAAGAVHLDAELSTEHHTASVETLLLEAEGLLARQGEETEATPATRRAVTAALTQLNTRGARRVEQGGPGGGGPGSPPEAPAPPVRTPAPEVPVEAVEPEVPAGTTVERERGAAGAVVDGVEVETSVSVPDVAPSDPDVPPSEEEVEQRRTVTRQFVDQVLAAVPEDERGVSVVDTDDGAAIVGLLADRGDATLSRPVPPTAVAAVSAGDVRLLAAVTDRRGNPRDRAADGALRGAPGGDAAVRMFGLPAEADGQIQVRSTARVLGVVSTDGAGRLANQVELPSDLPPGDHTLVITVGGTTTSVGISVEADFDDVSTGSVHVDAIEELAEDGVFQGRADGTFGPAQGLLRGQMATVLARLLNLDIDEGAAVPFVDVAGDATHAGAIAAIADEGFTEGCDNDGRFCPDTVVTRGQLAAFLARAYDLPEVDVDPFTDIATVMLADEIRAAAAAGIIDGFGDGTFRPGEPVSRAQAASMLLSAREAAEE